MNLALKENDVYRGYRVAGSNPQNRTVSARFRISPSVAVVRPRRCAAITPADIVADVMLSRAAPSTSAIATAAR